MGYLRDGIWHEGWYDTAASGGAFERPESRFRAQVADDDTSGFPAEPGRYHLYVSYACPWAHRTLIFRRLKRLENVIGVSVVHPVITAGGWAFRDGFHDDLNHFAFLHEAYTASDPEYSGRVTVPVLWDRQTRRIVNNESSEIIRMLNRAFDALTPVRTDFHPPHLRDEIDAVNDFVYERINNGVYQCGFAGTQDAYDRAVGTLFDALDLLDERLGQQRYLVGESLTEADWRVFPTLVRFDAVYYGHFKCSRKRLADYHHLSNYTRELYQLPGIAGTVNLEHIRRHYYQSHRHLNPTGIVPVGPVPDFSLPHDRARFASHPARRRV